MGELSSQGILLKCPCRENKPNSDGVANCRKHVMEAVEAAEAEAAALLTCTPAQPTTPELSVPMR
eukprot:6335582-Pyramimonas_sp.AAC.1